MALISCPECGRKVSDQAAACPSCAYPLHSPPAPAIAAPSQKKRGWLWAIAASVILLIVVAGGLLLSFGTVSPCVMLKQDLKAQLVRQAAMKQSSDNQWEKLGAGFGMLLAGPMIDNLVDTLTPLQCARGLWRMDIEGENIFADDLRAKTAEALAKPAETQPPTRIELPPSLHYVSPSSKPPPETWKADLAIIKQNVSRSGLTVTWRLTIKNNSQTNAYKDIQFKTEQFGQSGTKLAENPSAHTAYRNLYPGKTLDVSFTELAHAQAQKGDIEIAGAVRW